MREELGDKKKEELKEQIEMLYQRKKDLEESYHQAEMDYQEKVSENAAIISAMETLKGQLKYTENLREEEIRALVHKHGVQTDSSCIGLDFI